VQVFGRRHDRLSTRRDGQRPKSAKARNRGEEYGMGGAAGSAMGDLAVCGPQLRSAARLGEWWRWRCSLGATRFSDLRAGVSRKIGVAVAW
jgi:hypothetical protein